MDKKPTRPYLMNTYNRPHSANPKMMERNSNPAA